MKRDRKIFKNERMRKQYDLEFKREVSRKYMARQTIEAISRETEVNGKSCIGGNRRWW